MDSLKEFSATTLGRLARALQTKLDGTHTSEWQLTDLGRLWTARAGKLIQQDIGPKVGCFDSDFCSS